MAIKPAFSYLAFTLPVVVALALINIYLLMNMHHHNGETTVIFSEKVFNKNSDSSSGFVKPNLEQQRDKNSGGETQSGNYASEDVIFTDSLVDTMIANLRNTTKMKAMPMFPSFFWNMTMDKLSRQLGFVPRSKARTLAGYAETNTSGTLPAWEMVHRNIRQFSLYSPDDTNVDQLLHDMSTLPITEADKNDGGTQLKINVRLSDGGRAVLKPMRYGREVEADENRYIFDDIERHIAEIAAFQLDRVLGFYRVPPTAGRLVNITSELKPIVPKFIDKTMFTSPAGNLCFYGKCAYYCDSAHAFCGHPDVIEASIMTYLPSQAGRKSWNQPWRRSYSYKTENCMQRVASLAADKLYRPTALLCFDYFSRHRKAYWEENDDLCVSIRKESPYNNGKLLLDMIDAHTFDFLTGNKDRHSFVIFKEFGYYTFPILYDNGRGFGRKTYDAMSILAPLKQCCLIRKSTFLKYVKVYLGPERLSDLMEKALKNDPVAPVLIKGHLTALDRRLVKILRTVAECLESNGYENVILEDRF